MTPTYQLIKRAIQEGKQVHCIAHGGRRQMCPYVLGRNKRGALQALFYQFGGYSRSGLAPDGSADNWRCYNLSDVSSVTLVDGPWHSPNHWSSGTQVCVAVVEVSR